MPTRDILKVGMGAAYPAVNASKPNSVPHL